MIVNLTPNLIEWLTRGERGLSSERMAEIFAGFPIGTLTENWRNCYPHDPADFRLCLALLAQCPEFNTPAMLQKVADSGKEWAKLIPHWDELTELYKSEYVTGKAPKTYEKMHELLYGEE